MIINTPGEYTLQYTATDACGNSTTVERDLVVEAPPVYGVEWDTTDYSIKTRTDLATDFPDPQPAVNNGTGSSPFDNIMPWSGMEIVEDADAGTLVSIPKFYYQWESQAGKRTLRISPTQQDGFLVSPAHADRGDGVGERDVVYVGRYHCASDYKSKTNQTPLGNVSIVNFRQGIHSLGTDIWQNDLALLWTIRFLYLVEFADWDSQSAIGYGCSPSGTKFSVGATDGMSYHTGTSATTRTTYGSTQYRHIEGLWDNVEDFVDGVYKQNYSIYAIKNPINFNNQNGGTHIGTIVNSSGKIGSYDFSSVSGFEYVGLPIWGGGGDYSSPLYDELFTAQSATVFTYGARSNQDLSYGLFRYAAYCDESTTNANVGSRLMKLPSA